MYAWQLNDAVTDIVAMAPVDMIAEAERCKLAAERGAPDQGPIADGWMALATATMALAVQRGVPEGWATKVALREAFRGYLDSGTGLAIAEFPS